MSYIENIPADLVIYLFSIIVHIIERNIIENDWKSGEFTFRARFKPPPWSHPALVYWSSIQYTEKVWFKIGRPEWIKGTILDITIKSSFFKDSR